MDKWILVFCLALILFVSGCIDSGYVIEPRDDLREIVSKINASLANQGSLEITDLILFTKDNRIFSSNVIVGRANSISNEQLCLDLDPELKGVFTNYNSFIEYIGNDQVTVKALIVCKPGDTIRESLEISGIANKFPTCQGRDSGQIICFVSIIDKDLYNV